MSDNIIYTLKRTNTPHTNNTSAKEAGIFHTSSFLSHTLFNVDFRFILLLLLPITTTLLLFIIIIIPYYSYLLLLLLPERIIITTILH